MQRLYQDVERQAEVQVGTRRSAAAQASASSADAVKSKAASEAAQRAADAHLPPAALLGAMQQVQREALLQAELEHRSAQPAAHAVGGVSPLAAKLAEPLSARAVRDEAASPHDELRDARAALDGLAAGESGERLAAQLRGAEDGSTQSLHGADTPGASTSTNEVAPGTCTAAELEHSAASSQPASGGSASERRSQGLSPND